MANRRLVTVVGSTGAQGGGVVRSLIETGKYKIRGLTRDSTSEKAQSIKDLSDDIEMVTCDINKSDDVKRAFKDSWAIYALTDFWAQPDQPEIEMQQGILMSDIAAELQIPYYIFSTLPDINKLSGEKYDVPHFSQKANISDYIKEKHPQLKTIFVEPAFYMQNWKGPLMTEKLDDGTVVFTAPINEKAKLHLIDIDDTGVIVREILNDPEKFVGQDICICGEAISFEDIIKIFTKITGVSAIFKTLTEQQFRSQSKQMSKFVQDDIFNCWKWFEEYGYYGKHKDWTNGQKLAKLNHFQDWLKKSGWKGD